MSGTVTYATVTAGMCLMMASWSGGAADDERADAVAATTGDAYGGPRSRRFVIANGEGVPDYDDGDDDGVDGYDPGHHDSGGGHGYDYDGWYPDVDSDDDHGHGHGHDDDDDDDDFDFDLDLDHHGPGYHNHHVWWHYLYHHDEPHLPFPLFPPFFVHRLRPVYPRRRRGCAEWPFVCRNAYEVVQWLQCYHEFLGSSHADKFHGGVPVVPVHAWKKK